MADTVLVVVALLTVWLVVPLLAVKLPDAT